MEFVCVNGVRVERLESSPVPGFRYQERRWNHGILGWYEPIESDGSVHELETSRWLILAMGEPCSEWTVLEDWIAKYAGLPTEVSLDALVEAVKQINVVSTIIAVDRVSGVVCVCSDALGVRPWYWTLDSEALFVASTRRTMRAVSRRGIDPLGVIQVLQVGFTIGARTSIDGVKRNLPGEVLIHPHVTERLLNTRAQSEREKSQDELVSLLSDRFDAAIRSRLSRTDVPARAFLSGGLDSRVVVASLCERGVQPRVYSLAPSSSADTIIARQIAEHLKLKLRSLAFITERRVLWAGRLRRLLELTEDLQNDCVVTAWSGDGGSVCVGGVYVSESLSLLLRESVNGDPSTALTALGLSVPRGGVDDVCIPDLDRALRRDFEEELLRILDTGNEVNAYRFFVENDQRQHLDTHFENWRAHRVQFLLPFYDRRVTTLLLGQPESWIAYHGLYERWLDLLPSSVTSIPYQTYPGHPPSRKRLAEKVENQFGSRANGRFRSRVAQNGRSAFLRWVFRGIPELPPLSRKKILAAGIAELLRLRTSTVALTLLSDLSDPDGFGGLVIDDEGIS